MEWQGEELTNVLAWLEKAGRGQYVKERRIDPFATSMRDFDDVTQDLANLEKGHEPDKNDPSQRIVDLKAAKLAAPDQVGLSPLGQNTLVGWRKHGVANRDKADELARHLILVTEANRIEETAYRNYIQYWLELRGRYDPFELMENWDALITLNYLDFTNNGYCPGSRYSKHTESLEDLRFTLGEIASRYLEREEAIKGAERIEKAIAGKVPRNRHRATFCCALEIYAGEKSSIEKIVSRFGIPIRPRKWVSFKESQRLTIQRIVEAYGLPDNVEHETSNLNADVSKDENSEGTEATVVLKDSVQETKDADIELELPENIDFEEALVPLVPRSVNRKTSKHRRHVSQPTKVDHVAQAKLNKEVGDLGEEFAFRFELWRLRQYPDLQKKVFHVSKVDDSAGYDILSFDLDGTPRFVEVKSTLGSLRTPFYITAQERETSAEKREAFVILRVFNLKNSPKCCEIHFPFDHVIQLTPSSYTAIFV